jgi:cytochrome c553
MAQDSTLPPHDAEADRAFRRRATLAVAGLLALMMVLGFVVVPVVQGWSAGLDAWTAICRAIGVAPGSPAAPQPVSTASPVPVSNVSWGPETLGALRNASPERGAQVAELCISCHGQLGWSVGPDFPHLAGQSAFAIYKQLHDYRTGARQNEAMSAIVANLNDEAIADVAVHFTRREALARAETDDPVAAQLAIRGDTARGIAACNSCHFGNPGGPIESPTLVGQQREYLVAQLRAFANGTRRNDVYARMRSLASQLSENEINRLAAYYAAAYRP